MATYVPNVGQYLPELKPFTPDYKFLSNVLTTRQTKYDTNYKQLNNAYSRILYSDLSRQDTQGARDQFVNDLQPTLEKISGLDLSLAQNVKAANAVFEPFYQNDLVMKDMVYTKNFKDNVRYAESLMYSNDDETKDKYWREGIEYMGMKMEDFKNASQEQALNMQLEQYVENPQLYKRSLAYLKEQGYDVEIDTISPDQNFIIKNKNGENITKLALADLQMKFLKDPLINKGYYTKSYVDSRNYAKNQMEKGLASSVAQGITQYNIGKLEAYKMSNAAKIDMYDAKIEKYNEQLATVEKEMKGRTPKPGSSIDLAIKKLKNDLLAANMERELVNDNLEKAVNLLNSGDEKMINNMGYSVEMQANMMHDLEAAALNYSNRTAKKTLTVNQAHLQTRKEMHDVKMAQLRFNNQLLLEEKKTEEYEKQMEIKKRLFPDGEGTGKKTEKEKKNDILNKILGPLLAKDVTATREGVIKDISKENLMDLNKQNIQNIFNDAYEIQKSAYINYKTIQDANSKYNNMIKLPNGMEIKGVEIPYLSDDNGNVYVNSDNFIKLLDDDKNKKAFETEVQNQLNQIEDSKLPKIAPELGAYRNAIRKSNNKIKYGNKELEKLYQVAEHNLNNFNKINDINIPTVYQTKDGKAVELSQEEFIQQYVDEAIDKGHRIDLKQKGDWGSGEYIVWNTDEDTKQKYLNGELPLMITVNANKIYNAAGFSETFKKKTQIINPKLFTVKKGNISAEEKEKNKQFEKNVLNIDTSFAGRFKEGYKDPFPGSIKKTPRLPFYNYWDYSGSVKDIYKNQLEQLDKISKGDFMLPDDGAGVSASMNNTGYKFYSTFTGTDNLLENIGDLQIGFKSTTPLKNSHVDDPERFEESITNAAALLYAIKQPSSTVSKVSVTGRDEDGFKKQPLNDDQAFNFLQTTIASYLDGSLNEGDNKYYTLEYFPANKLDNNSKYIITQTEKDNKDKVLYTNKVEVTVPKNIDKNPLLEENNPDGTYLDVMLDEASNSMKDDYGYGGSLVITKNGSVYNINPIMSYYDPLKDEVVEQSIANTSLIDFPTQYTDATDVMKVREKYESMMLANEQLVRQKQKQYQENFTKYKEKNKDGTWEDFINNYPYNR